MRFTSRAFVAALFLTACVAPTWSAGAAPSPASASSPGMTLSEALSLAEQANPTLLAKRAQWDAAEGARTEASALLASNPQLTVDATRRNVPTDTGTVRRPEWSAGVAQTFEIAGQRGYRREATSQAFQALRFEIEDLERQQRAEVGQRFYKVLALQHRLALEKEATRLFAETARLVEQRRSAGEDTRLDANVALVEAERSRNQQAAVEDSLVQARSELAQPLQLPPDRLPEVSGQMEALGARLTEQELLASAKEHPRLQALSAREASAKAKLDLAQAGRYPDVTVGLSVGREGSLDARERLTTLSVSVPLPLFQRNDAAIGAASTEATQARVDHATAERDLPALIHAQVIRLDNLIQRIERLQRAVLPALANNESLAAKSLKAGQMGLLELVVANRQALDARRDLVDAQLDYQTTRLALEALAGWRDRP